jgi:type IV fimbrial biogenesis protein FimT
MRMNGTGSASPSRWRGFTLIETLMVVAILAVTAVLATPSFIAWHVRDAIDARARALVATLTYARGESMRRGMRVTVCRIDAARLCLATTKACAGGTLDWSCGWAVIVEPVAGAASVLRSQMDQPDIAVSGVLSQLTFAPPSGQAIGGLRSFDVGPRYPTRATQGNDWKRCIRIAAGGRVRMTTGACGAT